MEGEKCDSEYLSYNLMLNSGKKNCALRDRKNKYSNSRIVRKKNSERINKPSLTHINTILLDISVAC